MPIIENTTKRKLGRGELTLGMGVRQSRTADHVFVCKACGFDWLFIDLEHSSLSIEQASNMCVAAMAAGVTPFVRVASHEHHHATRLLDVGALGIIVPDVDTADQAAAIVRNCRYPPLGKRSIPSGIPQLQFEPMPVRQMMESINGEIAIVVMLESPLAIENADAIAATDGIDGIMIGSSDLAARIGTPGEFDAPQMQDAFAAMLDAARRHGKFSGFAGIPDERIQRSYIAKGARFVQCGTDIGFMQSAATSRVSYLRESPTLPHC
jgi:2-keto-3-deoxy-L-rhamnonate aldolase RhmA